jgi:hypothetical protein
MPEAKYVLIDIQEGDDEDAAIERLLDELVGPEPAPDIRENAEWDESKHPRKPKGGESGGEFAPSGDSGAGKPKTKAELRRAKREEDKFWNSHYVHSDIQGIEKGTSEENLKSILKNGFRGGPHVNLLPAFGFRGPRDRADIMSFNYWPKKGSIVYLVPESDIVVVHGTARVKTGWKPGPNQVFRIDDPDKSLYDYYREASGKKYEWQEEAHPRHPSGSDRGGEFAPKGSDSAANGKDSEKKTSGTVEGIVDPSELIVTSGSDAGPGFSPEQVRERDRVINSIDAVARNWLHNKTGGDREPTRGELAEMMKFVGTKYGDQVDKIIADFSDYTKYPDRPAIHLVVGEKNVPDVWLLGWREEQKGLEATPIHDHGASEAGIYVHKGSVNERIFAIDKKDFGKDTLAFHEVDRGLNEGSGITINAPYLHDIGASHGEKLSVTVHAYYPPLNDMGFYEVKGKKLVKSGSWKEDPNVMKAKGFRDHTFPCYHYHRRKYHEETPWGVHAYEWVGSKKKSVKKFEWNEEDHPRQPGGSEKGGEFAPKGGGLAEQRTAAIADVSKLADTIINKEVEVDVLEEDKFHVPESWDDVSESDQDAVKEQWIDDNKQEYYESAVENWWETEAIESARSYAVWQEKDWAKEKLSELLEEHGVDLEKSGLLDEKGELKEEVLGELWDKDADNEYAFRYNGQSGKWNDDKGLSYDSRKYELVDNSGLVSPEALGEMVDSEGNNLFVGSEAFPGQLGLAGVPKMPSSSETASDLLNDFERAVLEKTDDPQSFMEAPDAEYFQDSINDYIGESFDEKDDSEKFELAKDKYGSDWDDNERGETVTATLTPPSEWKLLSDGRDYERTKAIGNELSKERFLQVLADRGIKSNSDRAAQAIKDVWSSWTGDSGGRLAYAMQAAAADELGGNFYKSRDKDKADAVNDANELFPGGYDGLKAYVRAQWEVNQYLFDKAKVDHLDLYRAVMVPTKNLEGHTQKIVMDSTYGGMPYYTAVPTMFIHQNGAASFTAKESVANNWNGVGYRPDEPSERVVIRARVPSTAVLSLPVFGKNLASEEEVVVTGLPWKSWDAWRGRAPSNEEFNMLHPRGPDGRFVDKPGGSDAEKRAA